MKKDIHPQYIEATITCACGNQIKTHSTVGDIKVEICSACHPFFTGKQKLIDTAGRVDKFRARMEQAQKIQEATKEKKKRVTKNPDVEKLQKSLEKETVEITPTASNKVEK